MATTEFTFPVQRAVYGPDGRKIRRAAACKTRGNPNRRIIFIARYVDGKEYRYHATKGWRVYRA